MRPNGDEPPPPGRPPNGTRVMIGSGVSIISVVVVVLRVCSVVVLGMVTTSPHKSNRSAGVVIRLCSVLDARSGTVSVNCIVALSIADIRSCDATNGVTPIIRLIAVAIWSWRCFCRVSCICACLVVTPAIVPIISRVRGTTDTTDDVLDF